MGLYVQYGCGLCAPDGWLNFDASPTLRLQKIPLIGKFARPRFPDLARFGDIRKGLPVADGSADAVYCSHVLEHLSLEDFRIALKNSLRILKPGGKFRVLMPDLKVLAKRYVESTEPDAAMKFMRISVIGREKRPSGFSGLARSWLGNAEHLWMWDYPALAMELDKAGFKAIRPANCGDGGDVMFDKVEDETRWSDGLGAQCERG
jgi:SAM-dependent methyltransferase